MFEIFIIEDIKKELSKSDNEYIVKKIEHQMKLIKPNKNILIIGTGGSYITGLFSKGIIESKMLNLCDVLKPMEAIQSNIELYSYAIIYSYGLKSYEIKNIINKLMESRNIKKILILTSMDEHSIENPKIEIIRYDVKGLEKTYVSLKSIYYPSYLLLKSFNYDININCKLINECKILSTNNRILDIFYDKQSSYLAQLIERHFCELGILTARLHEKKDFSHGRMNIISGGDIIYLKSDKYEKEYDDILKRYLIDVKKCRILNFVEFKTKLNNIEKILLYLKWIAEMAEQKEIDIYNMQDTKEDEKLFKYKEDY